jgi:hypothetical protein
MNWQRGLWRMWLIVTLLWNVFVFWLVNPISEYRRIFYPTDPASYYAVLGRAAQMEAIRFMLMDWAIVARCQ